MKQLPIGISDFKELIETDYYYIDKSLFIKEIIDSSSKVLLFPRPRRFGKTINLSMLRYFFDCHEKDGHKLFENLDIWQAGEKYRERQGKHQVVFLTFKDVKKDNWEQCLQHIKSVLQKEIIRHDYLLKSDLLNKYDKRHLLNLLENKGSEVDFENSLSLLTECLATHFKTRPFLLIDEYDTPIHIGYLKGYYEKVMSFLRNLFSGGLKDNRYLEKGVVTGTLRISKESIFTGLNNLDTFTLLSNYFSNWFGLTEEEVNTILADFSLKDHKEKVSRWYNGYCFGQDVIYNPWSIINYASKPSNGFQTYWINTSSNELIRDLVVKGGEYLKEEIGYLLNGQEIEKPLDENIALNELGAYDEAVWNLLLFSGYLKVVKKTGDNYGLAIPNQEVDKFYRSIITRWLNTVVGSQRQQQLLQALVSGEIKRFSRLLQEFVVSMLSYHDTGGAEPERVYQAFILGMLVGLQSEYQVDSNRESGYGRYDVMVIPKDKSKKGIIIELKTIDDYHGDTVEQTLESALEQIDEKQYAQELLDRGIKDVVKLGIVIDGKRVWVKEG